MAEKAKTKAKKAKALIPRRASSELSRPELDMDRMFEDFLGRQTAAVLARTVVAGCRYEDHHTRRGSLRGEGRYRGQS